MNNVYMGRLASSFSLVYFSQWLLYSNSYLGVISALPSSVRNCSKLVIDGPTFILAVAVALTTAAD